MRIDITVRLPETVQDVRIDADPDACIGAVRAALARSCSLSTTGLWVDGVALADDGRWGSARLRTGMTVDAISDRHPGPGPAPAQVHEVSALHIVGGPHAGRSVPLGHGRLVVGRAAECDIVLDDPDASRRHAAIEVARGAVTVCDLGSTNGVTVDGTSVGDAGAVLAPGALLRIGCTLLSVSATSDPPAVARPGGDGRIHIVRSPRGPFAIADRVIEVPQRPREDHPRAVQWVASLLPAAAGGAIAWFTGSPEFLAFALLSPIMILTGSLGDRLSWRRARRRAAASFTKSTSAALDEVHRALSAETAARRRLAPDPVAVGQTARAPTERIWERGRSDDDLLTARVGTGVVRSAASVSDAAGTRPAGDLADVPVCVDLRDGPVGLAGPVRLVDGMTRWLVGQVAVFCSPADLEVVLLLSQERAPRWRWARWLPHLRSETGTDPARWAGVIDDLAARLGSPGSTLAPASVHRWPGRWSLLVVDGIDVASVPGLAHVLAAGPAIGVTAIVVAPDTSGLPTICTSFVRVCADDGHHVAITCTDRGTGTHEGRAVADLVDPDWAVGVARALAPLIDADAGADLAVPNTCRLGQLHEVHDPAAIEQGWTISAGGARAVVGMGADGPFTVDLAADGPHLLVAGTTGSGKSEFLQALVAGLAVAQPPDELTFVLVDYKGGAAFGECARLPHAAGLVTDLDPYLTERALRSLRCELRRREVLLAAVGAADLSQYRAERRDRPIPRMVIVVDEFASLAEDLPDFVAGIVAIAARGRSLGVHLVLATQRPGSAVSAEIRANTALRVALRVTDRSESTDVIDVPDAALIARSTPGRAYVRSGAAVSCLQTAWTGARSEPSTDDIEVIPLDDWRRPIERRDADSTRTDLDCLVESTRTAAHDRGTRSATPPWAAPLPELLRREDLPVALGSAAIAFALVDRPDEQRTVSLGFDVERGESLLIVGAARTGRTNTLATIALAAAERLGPAQLEIHTIDPTGRLAMITEVLPQAASMIGADDADLVLRLLRRLESECSRRARSPDGRDPRLLVLVDGWGAVASRFTDLDALALTQSMTSLLRTAASVGLSIVVSGDRDALTPRFTGAFDERMALRLADRSDYAVLGLRSRDVPSVLPPGRAVRGSDAAVLQIASVGPDDRVGTEQIATSGWDPVAVNPHSIRLRPLPVDVHRRDIRAVGSACADHRRRHAFLLGVAGDDATPLYLDVFDGPARLLVTGPPRSGRSSTLRLLHDEAVASGIPVLVAADPRSALAGAAATAGNTVVDPHGSAPDDLVEPATPTLVLVDDCESWGEARLADVLTRWVRRTDLPIAMVVAGCADDLATTYHGLGAEVRRSRRGILLRPGPLDGELLGLHLPRRPSQGPPGRGLIVGDRDWDERFADDAVLPIQIARP